MRLNKLIFLSVLTGCLFTACNKDDDNEAEVVPPRDQGEQALEDDNALVGFMETHFYNEEDFENPGTDFDYMVRFDTIAGENAGRTPIIESDLLTTKVVTRNDVDYKVYILKIREGSGMKPFVTDSTFVRYRGELINHTVFDHAVVPTWFDLSGYIIRNSQNQLARSGGVVSGFAEGITEFREASGYEVNPDNTIKWNDDFGVGAIFFPSGLGYFNSPPSGIPAYSPLIFSVNLMRRVEADHDNDGIPSWMEDLDEDGNVFNDDTDSNGFPNHSDNDDDGDGTLTRDEIIIHEDGSIEFPDDNGNGIPNYLDPESFEKVE